MDRGNYIAAQAEFHAVLQIDATQQDALRFMTKSQQAIEVQHAKTRQRQDRLRRQAEELAVRVAREKAHARTQQEAQSREQVAHAREQQLKFLYSKGLSAYRADQFEAAAEIFQQMVLLDPQHPLVREAQRLIIRAEAKLMDARARAAARGSAGGTAVVSELEQQLTAKRIEIDTALKYAELAINERNYDLAIQLVQRALTQDPQHRRAQEMLQRTQMAKLKDEEERLKRKVDQDERVMVNDVVKAQVLPESREVQWTPPTPAAPVTPSTLTAKLQEPISAEFEDVALSDVVEFLADAANVSIIPSPQLDLKARRVSMKIAQLPLEQALKYLVRNQGLAYRVEQDAVLIGTSEEFSNEPMETQVFFLRNGLGPAALEVSAVTPNPALTMESLKNLVERSVPQPPDSKLVVDERSGALVVTNTTENLKLVEQLLSQLDVTPTQVFIEARFVELTVGELEQHGLEAVLTGDYALSKVPVGDAQTQGNIIAKGAGFKFPDLSRQDEGGHLTLEGVLTGLQFEAVLHLLEESKKSKTLSCPRLTTLNNQTAQIRVVEEFNYPTRYEVSLIQFDSNGDGDFDDAGETEFANVPKDFQKRDVGILLNVTPSVGKDLRTITLVLSPEVSQFSQFRALGGGVSVPEFTSSQLTTSVVVADGQTVVLGGLMKDTTSHQVMKVPVLGDLPLVGGLFRQREESSTRKNLLIFITARLLAPKGPTT